MTRSIFRLLFLFITLALAACPALAQVIRGEVRYADGHQPAFNVPIECAGSNCSGYRYTDRTGRFTWTFGGGAGGISGGTGNYTITVKAPGYITETRSVTFLDVNQSEYMFITLRRDPKALGAPAAAPAVIDPRVPEPARKEYEAGAKEVNAGKADKTLQRAIQINSKRTEAHIALGEVYRQQKKYAEAEKTLRAALDIDDKSWAGHYTLARVYVDANAFPPAAPEIEKANQIRPDYAEGHLMAANIYIKTRNAEGALKEFEEYLRLDPKGKFAQQAQNAVTKLKEMLKK